MSQVIYMPKTTNPWEAMLPQFLSQMILQDQAMKLKSKYLDEENTRRDEGIRADLAMTEGVSEVPTEPYAAPPSGNTFQRAGRQYSYTTPPPKKTALAPSTVKGDKTWLIFDPNDKTLTDTRVSVEGTAPSIQQDTDDKGNVTITALDKENGKQVWQKNLGPIGKTIQPSVSFMPSSEGIITGITKGPGAGTIKGPTGFGRPIPAAAAEKIGSLEGLLNDVASVEKLAKIGTKEEISDWTGPIAGRIGSAKTKYLGSATEEQVQFYAYTDDMQDALLRARSGAQINEQEYERLRGFLPDKTTPWNTYKARLTRFKAELNNVLTTKKKALQEGGYGAQPTNKTIPTVKSMSNEELLKALGD